MARVRLQDVAALAGVSMKTVSNVVHGHPVVRAETRERVQRAIDQLGYRPHLQARNLVTGRTGLLALAFPTLLNPYFAELAHVFSAAAAERGYRLLLEETGGHSDSERQILSGREAGMVDGVLFHPMRLTSVEIAQAAGDLPLVLLGEEPAPISNDHVMIDNLAAAAEAVAHLLALGRRRIGFLGHEAGELSHTSRTRLLGYQQGLEAGRLRLDTSLLVRAETGDAAGAERALSAALNDGLQIDALICRHDLVAIGALRALAAHGLTVPGDVAIIGWDDITVAAELRPSLTSVQPDLPALARRALDLLAERIDDYSGVGRHELVGHRLAVRESAPAS
ncbi:LacI family transcriptional regulator [Microlunatus elymi]|uniref:LacI family transcriptional regulator n=1 Tax=Microlunatus elymi TaxID=2596828 RepID=A0A516PU34_9ACTN|nr:LacI family DNA-binding transcriptional regulator [Microlunatus elymi]QDP94698.1 LacI family transcriptional regulator [Microlunatus elymi]